MTPGEYEPRRGSLAERLIDYLEATGEPRISRVEVAKRFSVNTYTIGPSLEPAIRHGALCEMRIDGRVWYALPDADSEDPRVPAFVEAAGPDEEHEPPATDPTPGRFLMSLWSDGELDILGAQAISGNGMDGVRLSADQVDQLWRLLAGRG